MEKDAIFLDDRRNPIDVLNYIQDKDYALDMWIIVRSHDEFVSKILEVWKDSGRLPSLLSFDHDLGQEHIDYYFNNGGHDNPPDPSRANFTEKTGYDSALWLVEFCMDNNVRLPAYKVHSRNPCGKVNIDSILRNFKKHQANG